MSSPVLYANAHTIFKAVNDRDAYEFMMYSILINSFDWGNLLLEFVISHNIEEYKACIYPKNGRCISCIHR